jgi:hypothetical protein
MVSLLHPYVTLEKSPSLPPSTLLRSLTSISSQKTMDPIISLLILKNIIERFGNIKKMQGKEAFEEL